VIDSPEGIAAACRILHREGHEHLVFGHVSARAPDGTIWVKAAGLGLEEIDATGIARMDLDGRPVGDGPPLHDEMPLHTEIYRARPDVGAIVHTHPVSTIAMSLFREGLAPISQDAVPFHGRLARYESARLISTPELGRELAACLGDARAAILRAHGIVTVGADVREATVNAVLLARAARIEAAAAAFGVPEPMSGADVAALDAHFERSRARRVDGIWGYLTRTGSD
jgi:L-fuculose-phosphate aldolase